jgi:hypothetical protein
MLPIDTLDHNLGSGLASIQARQLFQPASRVPKQRETEEQQQSYAAGWLDGNHMAVMASERDAHLAEKKSLDDRRQAWRDGRTTGYAAAHAEIMANLGRYVSAILGRCDEIGRNARDEARKTSDQWIAERVAEMEHHSRRIHAAMGHLHEYRGGPVDWETGETA